MSPDDPRHGTERGYVAHRRAEEVPCYPCREAHAAYHRQRRTDAAVQESERLRNKAATRARVRLSQVHADEYRLYYEEECAALASDGEP